MSNCVDSDALLLQLTVGCTLNSMTWYLFDQKRETGLKFSVNEEKVPKSCKDFVAKLAGWHSVIMDV